MTTWTPGRWIAWCVALALATGTTACGGSTSPAETADSEAMREAYAAYGVSVSRRAGDTLYIGGLVAFEDDGSVHAPGDGARQITMIYERLRKILALHGATLHDVVRENAFLTDWEEFGNGAPVRLAVYDDAGAPYPAATAVQVISLAEEGLVVEMDFVAHLGD